MIRSALCMSMIVVYGPPVYAYINSYHGLYTTVCYFLKGHQFEAIDLKRRECLKISKYWLTNVFR